MLILDSRGVLESPLKDAVSRLPEKAKVLQAELTELLKTKRFVECGIHAKAACENRDHLAVMRSLCSSCEVDAAIVTPTTREKISETAILIDDFLVSTLEPVALAAKRSQRLDTLSDQERREVWRRAFSFTPWLNIFDQYIGRAEIADGFLDGLRLLVEEWLEHLHETKTQPKLDIYTGVIYPPFDSETPSSRTERLQRNGTHINGRVAELRAALSTLDLQLNVHFLDVPKSSFHRRLIKTRHATFVIERGVDLKDRLDRWMVNWLEFNDSSDDYMRDLRRAPTLVQNSVGKWITK